MTTTAHIDDVPEISEHANLKFSPVVLENKSVESIVCGTRVATPFGVGIVKVAGQAQATVALGWGIAYVNEKYLDFNVLPHVLRTADTLRELGDSLVRQKNFKDAAICYERAYRLLPRTYQEQPNNKPNVSNMCSILALCFLRCQEPEKALQWCDVALKMEPENTKAWFRQGQAHVRLGNYDEADLIFKKVGLSAAGADADLLKKEMKANLELLEKQNKQEKRHVSNLYEGYGSCTDSGGEDEAGPLKKKNAKNRDTSANSEPADDVDTTTKHSPASKRGEVISAFERLAKLLGIEVPETPRTTAGLLAIGAIVGASITIGVYKSLGR
eukprot:Platyproteum_vivax@DN3048_c0_g1_i1.p1